jgi:hypothetical protein
MTKKRVNFKDAILLSLAANSNTAVPSDDAKLIRQAAQEAIATHKRHNLDADEDLLRDFVEAIPLNTRGIEAEMREHFIPSKRRTKKKGKMTKGTSSWFNAVALKGVPGTSNSRSYAAIAQMYEEETGCLVIDDAADSNNEAALDLHRRLARSARNCDTTKGNYIV